MVRIPEDQFDEGWTAMEGKALRKGKFKTRVENATRNVNKWCVVDARGQCIVMEKSWVMMTDRTDKLFRYT